MNDINNQSTIEAGDLTEKVINVIAKKLSRKPEEISENARIIEDLGADSLDTVELIMELEEEFNIEIPDDDASKLVTVSDIVKYITTHEKK